MDSVRCIVVHVCDSISECETRFRLEMLSCKFVRSSASIQVLTSLRSHSSAYRRNISIKSIPTPLHSSYLARLRRRIHHFNCVIIIIVDQNCQQQLKFRTKMHTHNEIDNLFDVTMMRSRHAWLFIYCCRCKRYRNTVAHAKIILSITIYRPFYQFIEQQLLHFIITINCRVSLQLRPPNGIGVDETFHVTHMRSFIPSTPHAFDTANRSRCSFKVHCVLCTNDFYFRLTPFYWDMERGASC